MTAIQGIITFIHHEKNYCTIEFLAGGKKKTVNGKINENLTQGKNQEGKKHNFHVGDIVSFELNNSPRGDRQIAEKIQYKYNDALSNLLNQASENNEFTGYLKLVGEEYFVKETGSYLFFKLKFSPWQIKPGENSLNDPVLFQLENVSNPEKVTAKLKHPQFIPEFHKAEQLYRSKTATPAKVTNVTPHGIYLALFGGKIKARIPITKDQQSGDIKPLLIGDKIQVLITFLSPTKIVVARA